MILEWVECTNADFKSCHPFTRSVMHLNDEHIASSENTDLIMNMYNLIEYSDNYSDSTASLYQFKRQEQPKTDAGLGDITINNSSSFKYNPSNPLSHRLWRNAQIIVPLKHISNFFRSLALVLINTKLYIELNWSKHSVMYDAAGITTFQITKTELYIPVVTLKTADNTNLNKLLEKSFKKSVFWNEYKSKIQTITQAQNDNNLKEFC